ncbi:unnamed protein product [marine sediment metagenome]|uniref:Uncharacterized protein n=1 Tax=marine sediment metagenome TaxID=412755 RepID=X1RAT9_9ZZZZ
MKRLKGTAEEKKSSARTSPGDAEPPAEPDKTHASDTEVDTQQTHNFEPVDVAMGRIKEIVEKSRNENPDMPILILLDGRREDGKHIGKTTLADAIDTTHSLKNYYENKYKNFGLDDLNQDVIVVHGDTLRPLFKKKVDNPDEVEAIVEAIKMFHPGPVEYFDSLGIDKTAFL